MSAGVPTATLRALVAGVVDYAGLFPPAALSMRDAVARYAEYLRSPDAWMLGRFVVPASRLDELAVEAASHAAAGANPWRLAALIGDDAAADARRIADHDRVHGARLLVDVAELRAGTADAIAPAVRALGSALTTYVEIPIASEPRVLLEAVKRAGARAKVRTGGVTADAFPSAAQLARFVVCCAELDLPFKATAGLHHPLRGEQRLTYAPDSPSATMFGFINVFAAAAFAQAGMREDEVARLLEERDPRAIQLGGAELRWRGHAVQLESLARTRSSFALSFGSCSFREPIDDLHHLALL